MSAKKPTPKEWAALLKEVAPLRATARRVLGKVGRRTDMPEMVEDINLTLGSLSSIETGVNIEYHCSKR